MQPKEEATTDLKTHETMTGRKMLPAMSVERRDTLGPTAQVFPKMALLNQKAMTNEGMTTRVEDNLLVLLKEQTEAKTVAMASLDLDFVTPQSPILI